MFMRRAALSRVFDHDWLQLQLAKPLSNSASARIRAQHRVDVASACRAGWEALHQKFGSLPFADLMEPAIEIAERGHAVASIVAHKWAAAVPDLKDQPGFAQTFMPHGRAPEVSELVRFPGHAKTLRKLAEQ